MKESLLKQWIYFNTITVKINCSNKNLQQSSTIFNDLSIKNQSKANEMPLFRLI